MRKTVLISIVITAFLAALPANALGKAARQLIYEKYARELTSATSARDSLRILYNMYDLSARKGQLIHGWEILHTASRANDWTAQIDMIRSLGTFYPSNDSVMNLLLEYAERIPNRISRASTRTYLLNQYFNRKARDIVDPQLQIMLLDSITKSHNLGGDDIYDQLSVIYQIMQFLGVDAEGVLFRQSLDTYEELIAQLPMSDYPLKSQFNTTSAMIHSRLNGDARKAVQADYDMLELIRQLQDMYQKQNRKYRNYDVNKFISYRRMLSNYEALSPSEIEELHDSVLAICARDHDVQNSAIHNGNPSAFYYMAIKDYAKALPLLQGMFDAPWQNGYQRQKYYWMAMEAAKAIGDEEAYVDAMERFVESSMEIDSLKTISIRKEMLVRDSILPTPLLHNVATHGKSRSGQASRYAMTFVVISALLALLLMVYMVLYVRLRRRQSSR